MRAVLHSLLSIPDDADDNTLLGKIGILAETHGMRVADLISVMYLSPRDKLRLTSACCSGDAININKTYM